MIYANNDIYAAIEKIKQNSNVYCPINTDFYTILKSIFDFCDVFVLDNPIFIINDIIYNNIENKYELINNRYECVSFKGNSEQILELLRKTKKDKQVVYIYSLYSQKCSNFYVNPNLNFDNIYFIRFTSLQANSSTKKELLKYKIEKRKKIANYVLNYKSKINLPKPKNPALNFSDWKKHNTNIFANIKKFFKGKRI